MEFQSCNQFIVAVPLNTTNCVLAGKIFTAAAQRLPIFWAKNTLQVNVGFCSILKNAGVGSLADPHSRGYCCIQWRCHKLDSIRKEYVVWLQDFSAAVLPNIIKISYQLSE